MATEANGRPDFGQAGLKAWGLALVKTGTAHLDLSMVRQGKKALKEVEERGRLPADPK